MVSQIYDGAVRGGSAFLCHAPFLHGSGDVYPGAVLAFGDFRGYYSGAFVLPDVIPEHFGPGAGEREVSSLVVPGKGELGWFCESSQ